MSVQTVNGPYFFGGAGRFTTTLFTFFDTFSSSSLLSFDGFSRKSLLPDDFAGGAGVVSGVVTRVFFSEFFPRPFPFPSACDEDDDDVVASAVP